MAGGPFVLWTTWAPANPDIDRSATDGPGSLHAND